MPEISGKPRRHAIPRRLRKTWCWFIHRRHWYSAAHEGGRWFNTCMIDGFVFRALKEDKHGE